MEQGESRSGKWSFDVSRVYLSESHPEKGNGKAETGVRLYEKVVEI